MSARAQRFTIGRGRGCDLVIMHESLSRLHAELEMLKDGSLLLTDCHSTNGTHLQTPEGEVPVSQELVSPGDTLRFGEKSVSVKEILETIRLRRPPGSVGAAREPGPERPSQQKPWVRGRRLVRCDCGHVKPRGQSCPECGQ